MKEGNVAVHWVLLCSSQRLSTPMLGAADCFTRSGTGRTFGLCVVLLSWSLLYWMARSYNCFLPQHVARRNSESILCWPFVMSVLSPMIDAVTRQTHQLGLHPVVGRKGSSPPHCGTYSSARAFEKVREDYPPVGVLAASRNS